MTVYREKDVQFFQFLSTLNSSIDTFCTIYLSKCILTRADFSKIVIFHLQEREYPLSISCTYDFLERNRLAYALVAAGQLFFVLSKHRLSLTEENGLARSPLIRHVDRGRYISQLQSRAATNWFRSYDRSVQGSIRGTTSLRSVPVKTILNNES